MRVLFWYCDRFAWVPSMKTLDDSPDADAASYEKQVVAFVHVEPADLEEGSSAETKLVKNSKWLARKWDTKNVILHSFAHLGEDKADPAGARALLDRAQQRLIAAEYAVIQTPYGYFLDIQIDAPGKPLARIYKEF
ncbi:MAG: hypothetical protein J7M25_00055 [Deltaproteobacteria bacterium]|nr:hypothetical protein [Deltaproteobacteria bacterium]